LPGLGHCVFDDDVCNHIVEKLNDASWLMSKTLCLDLTALSSFATE